MKLNKYIDFSDEVRKAGAISKMLYLLQKLQVKFAVSIKSCFCYNKAWIG